MFQAATVRTRLTTESTDFSPKTIFPKKTIAALWAKNPVHKSVEISAFGIGRVPLSMRAVPDYLIKLSSWFLMVKGWLLEALSANIPFFVMIKY